MRAKCLVSVLSAMASLLVVIAPVAAGSSRPGPQIVRWVSFDVPGSTYTQGSAINERGDVTGMSFDALGAAHGFLRKADGTIVSFDAPGASGTYPMAINNRGTTAGYFYDSATPAGTHGFVRSEDGEFVVIDDPNSNSAPVSTVVNAISDSGVIVGSYADTATIHGFVRARDGAYETIDGPAGAISNNCVDVNEDGRIACTYAVLEGGFGSSRGLIRLRDGKTVTFDAPGAGPQGTVVGGQCAYGGFQVLTEDGAVTGYYSDAGGAAYGYVRRASGSMTEFAAPDAGTGIVPASINRRGTVVGGFAGGPSVLGDAFARFADGEFVAFDAPAAGQLGTSACAVNSSNRITGYWIDAGFTGHGFIAVAERR